MRKQRERKWKLFPPTQEKMPTCPQPICMPNSVSKSTVPGWVLQAEMCGGGAVKLWVFLGGYVRCWRRVTPLL